MKKNATTIIAIALPIVFIVIFAVFLAVTRVDINPAHDFVYKTVEYNYPLYEKTPESGDALGSSRVMEKPELIETFYIYSVQDESSNEISTAEISALNISTNPKSSDGYIVQYDYDYSDILTIFGGENQSGYYIMKSGEETRGAKKVKIEDHYRGSFEFVGWIEN
jgi:hypothetical protein